MTNIYTPIRIVLADDHEIFRKGFRVLFKKQDELELIGEAENGRELLEQVGALQPDVVITDIQMPLMDGIEACRQIRKAYPHIGVIALTMFNENNLIIDMLEAGAQGYLLKNTSKEELLQAARAVYEGHTYYCQATDAKLRKLIATSKYNPYRQRDKPVFTERELEVIRLICQQLTSKEIADRLHLSTRTIETHREHIQEKMRARNAIGIAIYAVKHELISLNDIE